VRSLAVILLPAANRDISLAVARYRAVGGPTVAAGFISALERALGHIGEFPESGATRLCVEAGLDNVRYWPLERYPFIVFYRPDTDRVDVWRVLHSRGDTFSALSPLSGH